MLKGCKTPETINCTTVGSYVVPPEGWDVLYIDDWCIDADVLYHRHPEIVGYDFDGAEGVVEYDVSDRVCWKCEARCPDTVWFAHRLQQI